MQYIVNHDTTYCFTPVSFAEIGKHQPQRQNNEFSKFYESRGKLTHRRLNLNGSKVNLNLNLNLNDKGAYKRSALFPWQRTQHQTLHGRTSWMPTNPHQDIMVQNLQFLFDRVPTTSINRYGLLNEASDEKYWTKLVQYLLHSDAPLPEHSSLVALSSSPVTGAKTTLMLSSPQHRATKRQSQRLQLRAWSSAASPNFDFDPKQWMNDPVLLADKVGHSLSHTLKLLGLGLGASEKSKWPGSITRIRTIKRWWAWQRQEHPNFSNWRTMPTCSSDSEENYDASMDTELSNMAPIRDTQC